MATTSFADRCRDLLRRVEQGSVTVVLVNPEDVEGGTGGNRIYRTSDGWTVVVFDDCGAWDYIDSFQSPEGARIDFDEMSGTADNLANYEPGEDAIREAWGWKPS